MRYLIIFGMLMFLLPLRITAEENAAMDTVPAPVAEKAQEASPAPEKTSPKPKSFSDVIESLPDPEPFNESCRKQMDEVKDLMQERTECWGDGDCLAVRFGCPWEAAGCDHTIISTDDEQELKELTDAMVQFEVQCVDKTPGMRDYCNAVNILSFKQRCVAPELKCLNGTCVNQTRVLIQGQE